MPIAYSYLRFSSARQEQGDSLRRQEQLAETYAQKHNLQLNTTLTYRDLGVSAFKGAHLEKGALGSFVRAIDEGIVASGSYLLVYFPKPRRCVWPCSQIVRGLLP